MEKTLARSRWWRILPVVFITYGLAYIDRTNYGFAAAGDMAKDLAITPKISSLIGALFFLGYFSFQIPGALYADNKSTRKLIFWSLILWGAMATATGLVSNVWLLMVIRFMLGVMESAVFPALLILLVKWFTKKERSRANTILMLGNPLTMSCMSIISGYLVAAYSWRGMFIIEGAPAILWAVCWWLLIKDRPTEAKWLTEQQKADLDEALRKEQQGIKPVKNYKAAFKSRVVVLLCFQYAFWSIGVYGFVMWLPSIVKAGPNMDIVETGWLTSLPYILAIVCMFIVSYLSDKTLNRKGYIWSSLLVGAIAFYTSYLVGTDNFWLSFACMMVAGAAMYTPYGPFFAAIPEALPGNVTAGALAIINSCGALGAFFGAYLVGYLKDATGGYGASFVFMSGSLLLASILTMLAFKPPTRVHKAEMVVIEPS